jgi:hypothetical protein
MKRFEPPRLLIGAILLIVAVTCPVPSYAQSPGVARRSLSIDAGFHAGEVGGATTYGPALSAIGWHRTSGSTALRVDLSYRYNTRRLLRVCWPNEEICPTAGTMSYMTAVGAGMMIGRLSSPSTRYYMHAGGEVLGMRALSYRRGGVVGLPKVGVGAVFVREAVHAEFTARWRNWRDGPLRQFTFTLGWHR